MKYILGSGFSECIYHKALSYELINHNYNIEFEKIIPIIYKTYHVGIGRIDLYVKETNLNNTSNNINIIVELKAITGHIGHKELTQINTYKKNINDNCIGIVINFPQPGVKQTNNEIEYLVLE